MIDDYVAGLTDAEKILYRFARLRRTEFRTNNMDDATIDGIEAKQLNAELLAVGFHFPDLVGRAFTGHQQILE